jgi:hypothetical protein
MTTGILSNRANTEFNFLAKLNLLTLAVLTSFLFLAVAPQAHAAGTTKNVKNRRMRKSSFQAQPAPVPAGCNLVHCTNSVPIFYPALDMVCPAPAGATCTYYIHLESQVRVSYQDAGLFRFLIDGLAPDPGPTDAGGLFEWLDNDPDSPIINWDARSYAVVATVTNTEANQAHLIEAQIGCHDSDGNGTCSATSGLSNLEVNVYTP